MQKLTPVDISHLSDTQILATINQLKVAYQLKRTLRYGTSRNLQVHSESVAEHVFALMFLMQYFLPLEDSMSVLNVEKIYRILIFHDFGEIVHGDIPYHIKTKADEAREHLDAKAVFESLPSELGRLAHDAWQEYEEHSTLEGAFAYALDKLEPMFELLDPINQKTLKRTKFTYGDHIGKKRRATENFPVMRRFVEVGSSELLSRGVFWTGDDILNQ